MIRGITLGLLLLLAVIYLAPAPALAFSSTRAAALWRTEALVRVAVAHAEAGDMVAAGESLALAVEASEFITNDKERARARGFVTWTRARLGDAEGAFAEALAIEPESDRLVALLRLAATYEARGDEARLRRALEPLREVMWEHISRGKLPDEDLVPIYFFWLEARIGSAGNALALAETIDLEMDRVGFQIITAGGQLAAGDRDGARRTIESLIGNLTPESQVWDDEVLLSLLAYAQSLTLDAPGDYDWAAELMDIEDRALMFALIAAGRATLGDIEGTFEAARRVNAELDRQGRLGLKAGPVSPEDIGRLELPPEALLRVVTVDWSGPAARAGLRVDDVLLGLDDNKLVRREDLPPLIEGLPAGTPVELTVWRSGAPQRIPVMLGRARAGANFFIFDAEVLATSAEPVALVRAGDVAGALARARAIENDRLRLLASLILAGALEVLGDRTGANAAAAIALAVSPTGSDGRKRSSTEMFGQPVVAHMLVGDREAALAALSDSDDEGEHVDSFNDEEEDIDALVAWLRVWALALTGELVGLPEAGLEFWTRLAIFENRPGPSITRAELQAMAGDAPAALATAKGITDDHDRNLAWERIAFVQATAGDIDGARATAERISHMEQRNATLTGIDAIANGTGTTGAVDASTAPSLERAAAMADPYRRSRALGAVARARLASGRRDAARETIALAQVAAEAETAPFYRALALVGVAQALVAVGDMEAALEILPLAQAAAQAIEVPPKQG